MPFTNVSAMITLRVPRILPTTEDNAMPKIALSLMVLLVATSVAIPQYATAQEWGGGLRLGTSIATLRGNSNTSFGYRATLAGGAGVSYRFNEYFGTRAEVMYVQRGGSTDNAIIGGVETGLTGDVTITYVDLPLLLTLDLPTRSSVVPNIFAGAAYASNVETLIVLRDETGAETSNSDNSIAGTDYLGIVGAGLAFNISGQRVVLEGRATIGLNNVRPTRPDAPLRNTSFLITAGLDF
ncbi:MAG: porin family protein [Rhodothermales bacterium]